MARVLQFSAYASPLRALMATLALMALPAMQGCVSLSPDVYKSSADTHRIWQPEDQLRWESVKLPGKVSTQYALVKVKADGTGHSSLQGTAHSAASMLRQQLRIEPDQLNDVIFSWQVSNLIEGADMALRDHDDSPVRVVLAFDGDRGRFSAKNAMLNELALLVTGEPMPYATLMYVWCNKRPLNSVIENSRTDRIRKVVVESGAGRLNQWLSYERNIRADYEKAFGEPPGALIGIGLMTDSDNTRSFAQGWYGTIALK